MFRVKTSWDLKGIIRKILYNKMTLPNLCSLVCCVQVAAQYSVDSTPIPRYVCLLCSNAVHHYQDMFATCVPTLYTIMFATCVPTLYIIMFATCVPTLYIVRFATCVPTLFIIMCATCVPTLYIISFATCIPTLYIIMFATCVPTLYTITKIVLPLVFQHCTPLLRYVCHFFFFNTIHHCKDMYVCHLCSNSVHHY